ncbi:UrcA family protein [Rhizomicrobium electricum]|uniref:UrcA family protein n=1 Tax=Rhizomicrobium electricum TaxID=480070 RepID=A0ABP3QBP8_9PROT|nr:UrcA family protein [Rhizomicrobium electricum]NIJ46745.1 UrcA family protein [Rhizomicrobium electricum]
MKRFSIAAAALTAALSVPALSVPALAEGHSVLVSGLAPMHAGGYQLKTIKVTYDDIDATTAHGAKALLDRIAAAARIVCGERSGFLMNGERAKEFAACRARATAQAVESLGMPDLAKIAATR